MALIRDLSSAQLAFQISGGTADQFVVVKDEHADDVRMGLGCCGTGVCPGNHVAPVRGNGLQRQLQAVKSDKWKVKR